MPTDTELLDVLTNAKTPEERAKAMNVINTGLGGHFAKYAAQSLYVVAGEMAVERRERGYKNPMDARNKSNRVPDAVGSTPCCWDRAILSGRRRRSQRLLAGGQKLFRKIYPSIP